MSRILNRFTKDMGSVDELLPSSLLDVLQIGLVVIGIVGVLVLVNAWLLIPTFIVACIFYFLRNFYLKTSRGVKRLEGITRSPVVTHLNASLHGLTTIRAFSAEAVLEKEFDSHQQRRAELSSSRSTGLSYCRAKCVMPPPEKPSTVKTRSMSDSDILSSTSSQLENLVKEIREFREESKKEMREFREE
ncbi:hypothetical protein J6590_054249 [Homalodisca vitripennis]|nr:hypothetical protein J6590_054249 [Homalodisca vitripennis]